MFTLNLRKTFLNFIAVMFIDNRGWYINFWKSRLRVYVLTLLVFESGNETRCVVKFAPYQKLPKERKKPDPRQGSIETGKMNWMRLLLLQTRINDAPTFNTTNFKFIPIDPDYLAFLEFLKNLSMIPVSLSLRNSNRGYLTLPQPPLRNLHLLHC